jgi:D-alanyl-D-alanine carboxypeptidase
MHGLMLPSGNDAAHCLAEFFGGLLQKEAKEIEDREKKEEAQKIKD